MMYLPSLFGEDLFDNWFDDFDRAFYQAKSTAQQKTHGLMRTDVVEKDDHYELNVDLPGYKKEDIELSLDQGYLKISAKKDQNTEEKNKEGKVIRRERYSGSMARSFYVGDDITEEDVQAKFENGVLTVSVPKKDVQKAVPEKKTIAIEG